MKTTPLETSNPDVHLIEPDVERDALLSVEWLEGEIGRETLRLMGVADKDNQPTTIEQERERVKDFVEKEDQLNWMITYQDMVVGSIWVELRQTKYVQSPALHIMIGDPEARGKGIGLSATTTVVEYLEKQGYEHIYSRYLTNNEVSRNLLSQIGFHQMGTPYTDEDNLEFQNVIKSKI